MLFFALLPGLVDLCWNRVYRTGQGADTMKYSSDFFFSLFFVVSQTTTFQDRREGWQVK
jgi:hypothetical protein